MSKIDCSQSDVRLRGTRPSKRLQDDDAKYPSTKVLVPAMLAIWLAFFVVALVSKLYCDWNYLLISIYHRIAPSLAQLFRQ
jgi:hypothetical protein